MRQRVTLHFEAKATRRDLPEQIAQHLNVYDNGEWRIYSRKLDEPIIYREFEGTDFDSLMLQAARAASVVCDGELRFVAGTVKIMKLFMEFVPSVFPPIPVEREDMKRLVATIFVDQHEKQQEFLKQFTVPWPKGMRPSW